MLTLIPTMMRMMTSQSLSLNALAYALLLQGSSGSSGARLLTLGPFWFFRYPVCVAAEVLLVLPVPRRGGVFWDSRYPAELGGPCWVLRRPLVEPSGVCWSSGARVPFRSIVLRSRHLLGFFIFIFCFNGSSSLCLFPPALPRVVWGSLCLSLDILAPLYVESSFLLAPWGLFVWLLAAAPRSPLLSRGSFRNVRGRCGINIQILLLFSPPLRRFTL